MDAYRNGKGLIIKLSGHDIAAVKRARDKMASGDMIRKMDYLQIPEPIIKAVVSMLEAAYGEEEGDGNIVTLQNAVV